MRVLACMLVLAACGGPTAQPVALIAPVTPVETEPAAVPVTSDDPEGSHPATSTAVVTGQMLADAYQQVSVTGEWDEVLADFTNRVGAPTLVGKSPVGGANAQVWAIVEQDRCYLLSLETNELGNTEAHYGSFQRGQFLFDRCAAATATR